MRENLGELGIQYYFENNENKKKKGNEFIIGPIRYEVLIIHADGDITASIQKQSTELKLWIKVWLKYYSSVEERELTPDSHCFILSCSALFAVSQVSYSKPIEAIVINDL